MSLSESQVATGPAGVHRGRNILSVRLSEGEARTRFAAVPVARLGTADARGRPHVVAVTFAVEGDTVYTAVDQKPKSGTRLKRLRNVAENPWVTVLADEYSDDWATLWWARADGRATVLAAGTRWRSRCGCWRIVTGSTGRRRRPARCWRLRSSGGQAGRPPELRAARARQRRYSSTNSSRICGLRSSGSRRPASRMVSRIWARYSVQCGQPGQVALEPPPGRPGQRAFQVVGDQLDGLLAGEVTT